MKTGEINNNVIFLKEGIFEVSFTGKLNDLSDLINFYYNQYINTIKNKDNDENEEDLANHIKIMNYQKSKIERFFQKDISEEFSYVLFLVNAPSIFGFRSTERKKTKIVINEKENMKEEINIYYSNFCVKCYSNKGEYIYLDKNIFYKHIYGTDGLVQEETKICLIDFFKKTIKRLINIRYIKIWNLFLSNGVDKNLNLNINWDKLENDENIYTAVDKLLSILNEGQLYSNEMSKYINDYFEKEKQVTQNQKQKKRLFNQNYQSDKIKKILIFKNSKNLKVIKNINYSKNSKFMFNNINHRNEYNLEDKYKKVVKKILNMSQENLYKKVYFYGNKTRNINSAVSSSSLIFKNKSLFVSKTGKNITTNNYLSQINRKKTIPIENLSIIRSSHSHKKKKMDLNKIIEYRKASDTNIKKENKKNWENSPQFYLKKYKSIHFGSNRPLTSKSFYRNYMDLSKSNKENYCKERVRYIIRNTRILFTKAKNFDKIVRVKKSNSTL